MRALRLTCVAAAALALLLAGPEQPAVAQQVLEFKPVPRESVSRFERMRVVRRTRAVDREDTVTSIPEPPEPPETPETPVTPRPGDRSGSVMRIGSDIHVGPDEVIEGDLSSLNGDIVIEGHVEGDVVAMRGDVDLKSTARVDGDVVCLGGTLTEEPGAHVGGQKVTAAGPIGRVDRDIKLRERDRDHEDGVGSAIAWLLVMLLMGWIYARFAPARTAGAVDTLRRQPGMSLAIGGLVWALIAPSLVALALVVALLCITIVGIPVALAALLGYAVFLAVLATWGFVVGASLVGGIVASRRGLATVVPPPPAPAPAPSDASASASAVAAPLPGYAPPEPTIMRSVMFGILALIGACVVGKIIHEFGGPLHGLGALIRVLAIIASMLSLTIGAGALMRAEFVSGRLGRLWSGRRGRASGAPLATATATLVTATPAPAGPPPPPPAPPSTASPYEPPPTSPGTP